MPHDGDIVLLRNSERSTYRECRLRWDWSYNRKLGPVRDKGALVFGRLAHSALERRYPPGRKRGPHPAKTFEELYRAHPEAFSQWDEEGQRYDALELGISMMNEYVKEYGKDDHIKIVQPEQVIQIDVYTKQGVYICTWSGQVDAVYQNLLLSTTAQPVYGLLEHKTGKTIDEMVRVISGYGDQALGYSWAADLWLHEQGFLKEGHHLDHVEFNFLKKAMPDLRPQDAAGHRLNKPSKDALLERCAELKLVLPARAKVDDLTALLKRAGQKPELFGDVSKIQPGPLLHRYKLEFGPTELGDLNTRIRAEAWEMAQVRAGKLPIYKNPTKDCSWKCSFFEACELHSMGSDFEDMLKMEFTSWNPYEAYELEGEKV